MNVKKKMEGVPYKTRVKSFMFTMLATRAIVAFAVSTMRQFMSKVSPPYWMAKKHIMRYLRGILDFNLCFRGKDIAMRIGHEMQTIRDSPRCADFLLELESFYGNARNNQPLYCL